MTYQDHWVRGRLVKSGRRECQGRYHAIRDVLSGLPRPFYVLDLGAHAGYFSFRLAESLSAFVTAVDSHPFLQAMAQKNRNRRVSVLPRNITLEELRSLGQFDAILALSVLHHVPDWREWLSVLRAMTPRLIVETPHPAEDLPQAANRGELAEIVNALSNAQLLCYAPGHDRRHKRATVLLETGTVIPTTHATAGIVFAGSGNASKRMAQMLPQFERALGYRPHAGSLNLRVSERLALGRPSSVIRQPVDFQFWPATVNGVACHVMQPGTRGHAHSIEIVAACKLRDALFLSDGDGVTVEVAQRDLQSEPFQLGICTTAWGGYERYLPEWAVSICAQTAKPDRVTIVASLTPEQSGELDALFSAAQIPWRSVPVPKGADMGALRNLAVRETETEWVMHLDADDMLHPWCVEDCTALAPEADVISIGYTWDGVGRSRPLTRLHTGASVKRALSGHLVSHSPSPFRRMLWEQRPYLTGDLVDTALWIGFAHLGARFVPTERPCFIYRGHEDSHSNTITPERRAVAKRQLQRLRRGR